MKMSKYAWSPTKKTSAREPLAVPICSKMSYRTLKAQRTKAKVNVVNAADKNKKRRMRMSPNLRICILRWKEEIEKIIIK